MRIKRRGGEHRQRLWRWFLRGAHLADPGPALTRRLPAALALALLSGLVGCDDPECTSPPSASPQEPAALLLMRKPEELTVPAGVSAGNCGGDVRTLVTSVEVQIFGPNQEPVPHDTSLLTRGSPSATIRFTPTELGRYHFFVAFDPIATILQFDLLSVRDRSAEPPMDPLPLPCGVLERLRSGGWICDTRIYRGQDPIQQQIQVGRIAVAGDTVWVVSAAQIHRYVDTGTRLEVTASRAVQNGLPDFIHATEGELIMLDSSTIQRITFEGGALAATAPVPWEHSNIAGTIGDTGPQGVIFRTGDRLAILHRAFSPADNFHTESCTYQLNDGRFVRTGESCQVLRGTVVGFEPSVLWLADQSFPSGPLNALRRLEWVGTQFVPRGELEIPSTLTLSHPLRLFRTSGIPVLRPNSPPIPRTVRSAIPVYDPGQSQLRLEHLDAETTDPQASPSFFWGTLPSDPFSNSVPKGLRIRSIAPAP